MTHDSLTLCSFRGARCQRASEPARWKTCPTACRTAYTLFEMMVVVALIVLIASLAIPSLTGALSDARLDASADMIRARMADARSMAMEKGCAVRFGFAPGTGQFQIAADDSTLWGTVQTSDPVEDDDHMRGELLQDVIFSTDIPRFQTPPVQLPATTGSLAASSFPMGRAEHRSTRMGRLWTTSHFTSARWDSRRWRFSSAD